MKETLKSLIKVTPERIEVQKHCWKFTGISSLVIMLLYAVFAWVFTPAD